MLYVTKNTLTVYTIAIVQNSQALQYDQMHTALQTARNQASLETPLRAEELLTAHFNLAVLEDQKDTDKSPDAQKSTDNTQDAEPSASAPDEQTYIKIPSHYAENSATRRPHPQEQLPLLADASTDLSTRYQQVTSLMTLGTIFPILMSIHTHTQHSAIAHTTPLAQQPMPEVVNNNRCPDRITIQTCELDMHRTSRPWDNQPYGRRTRSQQALHARAYCKIQRRYPIQ